MLKDFSYNGDEFKAGAILSIEDEGAQAFIDDESCEKYDPEAEEAAKKAADEAKAAERAEQKSMLVEVLGDLTKKDDPENRVMTIKIGESELEKSGMGGFETDAQFLSAVMHAGKAGGRESEKLTKWQDVCVTKGLASSKAPTSVMEEGDDVQGGYLVPADVAALWMPPTLENDISTSRAFKIPIKGNRLQMPALVDATHVGSFFGGVIIYRPGEKGQKTPSKPHLRLIELTLHKMAVLVPLSDELMEDSSVSMAAFVNNVVPQAIAFQRDADHYYGTGANMALGAANPLNPALITVAAQPAQLVNTIIFENIVNMWARFKMVNQGSAVWVIGHDTFPQLATMAMAVGAGGVPVWMPAGGVSGKPYSTLMGLPALMSEKTQLLGTAGDIALIDWSQYYYADKGLKAAQSIHLWFDYDVQAFRFVLRSDGQPAWATPLTPANGGPTVSPFVVLATRP